MGPKSTGSLDQRQTRVRGFQQALSLDIPSVVVDGIVGPVTWQALVSGMLSF
jgi:peptidoglycan hydrolase-like protein with peptidoglycan-binding domain